MHKHLPLILAFLIVVVAGCGRSDLPPLGTVSGEVTLDDTKLEGALVEFQPLQSGEGSKPSYGRTDANGRYELIYVRGVNGALVGDHEVRITTRQSGDPDQGQQPVPEKVPAEYNSRTNLKETVTSGRNSIDFALKSGGEIESNEERQR